MTKIKSLSALAVITSLTFFHFSCTQSQGGSGPTATAAGVLTDKVAVLRDGYAGYTGTRDTTIYINNSDYTSYGFAGAAPVANTAGSSYEQAMAPYERSYGLISFDVSGLTTNMLEGSETCAANIDVMRADLDMYVSVSDQKYITITPLKPTAPAWTEAGATFTSANGVDNWTAGGTYPATPVLNDAKLGYFDAYDGVPNSGIFRRVSFSIPTDSVLEWVCDASKNKGLLFKLHSGLTDKARFFTREFADRTFRPMLTIYLKKK